MGGAPTPQIRASLAGDQSRREHVALGQQTLVVSATHWSASRPVACPAAVPVDDLLHCREPNSLAVEPALAVQLLEAPVISLA